MNSSAKYIGMDVHKESISIAVRNAAGKIAMECVIETKASMILQFVDGLRGDVHATHAVISDCLLATKHFGGDRRLPVS